MALVSCDNRCRGPNPRSGQRANTGRRCLSALFMSSVCGNDRARTEVFADRILMGLFCVFTGRNGSHLIGGLVKHRRLRACQPCGDTDTTTTINFGLSRGVFSRGL